MSATRACTSSGLQTIYNIASSFKFSVKYHLRADFFSLQESCFNLCVGMERVHRALSLSVAHGCWAHVCAVITLVLLPFLHIGVFTHMLWVPDKKPVNRSSCQCTCWDTVFKGTYQSQNSIGYKHMYFNATIQMTKIWIITLLYIIAAYEVIKYLWRLVASKKARYSLVILVIVDIYPHYYSWWAYVNYYNDDYYKQYYHQIFFSISEMAATGLVLNICHKDRWINKWKLITLMSISCSHVGLGGVDQFIEQLILGSGKKFQKFRNLGMVIPDVLKIVVIAQEYRQFRKGLFTWPEHERLCKRDIITFIIAVLSLVLIGNKILL